MQFYYLGHPRLALGLYSPNLCAAVISCILLVTSGLLRHYWSHRLIRLALGILALAEMVLLGLTYSRGGYVATFLAFGTIALLEWRYPRPNSSANRQMPRWLPAVALLLILLLLPVGIKRLANVFNTSDRSILHRLYLWRGGTMLIAERPWTGYPKNSIAPGDLYSFFYQPIGHEENYGAFLNDYLNLALRYGLPVASICLTACLTLVLTGTWLWRKYHSIIALHLTAALLSLLVSSCFSNLFHARSAMLCLLFLAGAITIQSFRKSAKPPVSKILAVALSIGLIIGVLAYISGRWFQNHWQYRLNGPTLECAINHAYGKLHSRLPHAPTALVITDNLHDAFRSRILPLAYAGFEVTTLELTEETPSENISQILKNKKLINNETYLVALVPQIAARLPSVLSSLPLESQPFAAILEDIQLLHPMPEYALESYSWEKPLFLFNWQGLPDNELLARRYPRLYLVPPQEDFTTVCEKFFKLR